MKIHKTTFDELAGKSVTDLARELLAAGNQPDDQIEVYRGDRVDLRVTNIGIAATLMVVDDGNSNIRHGKYRESPADRIANKARAFASGSF